MAKRYSQGFKDRAVRMVRDRLSQDGSCSQGRAVSEIAPRLGVAVESLRRWYEQSLVEAGQRPGLTREEHAEIKRLKRENAELNQKLDFLMGQLHLAKKKMFGASFEQAAEQLLGQLSFLFNEAEAWTPREEKASEATAVAAHTRQKRSSDLDEVLPGGRYR